MKNIFIVFVLFTFSLLAQGEDSLQNAFNHFKKYKEYKTFDIRSATQLKQADEIVTTIKDNGVNVSGYTARLKEGEEYLCRITLFQGFEYAIVAGGDNNAVDIDLFVYDGEGNTVAMDRNLESVSYARLTKELADTTSLNNDKEIMYSEVSVRPLKTEKYWVKIKLRKSLTSTNDVAFLVGNRSVKN